VTDNSGATILLGVIAFSAIVQGFLICGIALGGRRLTRRLDEIQGKPQRGVLGVQTNAPNSISAWFRSE
jgi:hypothetical protein